jgi:UDP-galactopyranose mutase
MYDYVIVGAGMFGAVFARLATDAGYKCLVIDKREHIGGNCYTKEIEGINVHWYGPHIFHTSNENIWTFVNNFAKFNNFINSPKAMNNGNLYSLPFNMNTFNELWGITNPKEAKEKIEKEKIDIEPKNLEDQAMSLVGKEIYEKFIKHYTEKQWGKSTKDLPSFIIKRLPIRYTYDNNYFNDVYQGVPIDGYTKMFENILDGIEVKLNSNYFANKDYYNQIAKKIVYTGCIDEFFDYKFGKLEYRSLKFEHKILDTDNFQGNAVINYCDASVPYTRIIEHKHFEKNIKNKTVITYEYPKKYSEGMIQYYPVNDEKNQKIYNLYLEESNKTNNIIFGGRLAEYQYMDMHVVIASAMNKFKKEMEKE